MKVDILNSGSVAEKLGHLLCTYHLTISCAESCTGGLVSSMITDVPGSSAYLRGSIVSYTDFIKHKLLAVGEEELATVGAVSDVVAREMATGVRSIIETDLAVSTTGLAGPGGGSEEKPVGLVYIAVACKNNIICKRYVFSGNRTQIKEKAAETAIEMVYNYLLEHLEDEI